MDSIDMSMLSIYHLVSFSKNIRIIYVLCPLPKKTLRENFNKQFGTIFMVTTLLL